MKTLDFCHPGAVLIYFSAVTLTGMFSMNPLTACLSLCGAGLLFVARNGGKGGKSHLFYLGLFIIMTVLNPLFQHNGVTVLFVMNNNPVTLEALLYGAVSAAAIISAIYWFRSFSQIMTSDKLLCLFSALSPKAALLLSMILRYVPLFGQQTKKVNAAQKALGLYREDNIIDSIRGGMHVFSVMVTWTLENGIITADSMSARGYGTGKRTSFSPFRFRKSDGIWVILSCVPSLLTFLSMQKGGMNCVFFPEFSVKTGSFLSNLGYISYAFMCFLPFFVETGDKIKWHCLKSKI